MNIRRKDLIDISKHKTSLFKRNFSYNFACCWNDVPLNLKLLPLSPFKLYLKRLLLAEQNDYLLYCILLVVFRFFMETVTYNLDSFFLIFIYHI